MAQEKNILIYRLGSLGDIVISLPCFHHVRKTYPAAKITILTNQPVSGKAAPAMDILQNSGLCDEVISYPVSTRSFSELGKLRQSIRKLKPELLVNLAAGRGWVKSVRDEIFFRACGISKIVGTPLRRRDLEVRKSDLGFFEAESQRLASRLEVLGQVDLAQPSSWDLGITTEEKAKGFELLPDECGDVVAVSVGTKLPVKDWGVNNWEKFLSLLSTETGGVTLVLLGAADEWERSEKMGLSWAGKRINLCGKTSPRVAAAILERCRLFVGHDSGPMHLASVTGVPTLGIFSWLNPPGQWFPGHASWNSVKSIYPPLPEGGWNPGLQMKQSASEGIWLTQPDAVLKTAMELWKLNPNAAQNSDASLNPVNGAASPLKKSGTVPTPETPYQQIKAV